MSKIFLNISKSIKMAIYIQIKQEAIQWHKQISGYLFMLTNQNFYMLVLALTNQRVAEY
jgi:hypothetical protein